MKTKTISGQSLIFKNILVLAKGKLRRLGISEKEERWKK